MKGSAHRELAWINFKWPQTDLAHVCTGRHTSTQNRYEWIITYWIKYKAYFYSDSKKWENSFLTREKAQKQWHDQKNHHNAQPKIVMKQGPSIDYKTNWIKKFREYLTCLQYIPRDYFLIMKDKKYCYNGKISGSNLLRRIQS